MKRRTCRYRNCKAILSQYTPDAKYCFIHQRKAAHEEMLKDEFRQFLKGRSAWVRVTQWLNARSRPLAFASRQYPKAMRKIIHRTRYDNFHGLIPEHALLVKRAFFKKQMR